MSLAADSEAINSLGLARQLGSNRDSIEARIFLAVIQKLQTKCQIFRVLKDRRRRPGGLRRDPPPRDSGYSGNYRRGQALRLRLHRLLGTVVYERHISLVTKSRKRQSVLKSQIGNHHVCKPTSGSEHFQERLFTDPTVTCGLPEKINLTPFDRNKVNAARTGSR